MKQKHLKQIIIVNQKIKYVNIIGEKDDGSKRKEETTESLKFSSMFKQIFLEPKEEDLSETSIQANQWSSTPTKSSLPWIVGNWVPDSILA